MSDRIRLTPAMRDLLLEIWQNGSAYPLDRNHKRTFEALEALAVYTGTSGMGFEEVEPLWSKLNPDAKEQYRRLARLAITAARAEALK